MVALSAETDAVQWTSAAPEDLGAVHATEHGLFTVSTNGTIRFLSAETGRSLWEAPTDCKPASVLFHVPGFVPARDTSPDRPDPRLGLRDIILDNDNRLIPFRAWAVSLLGRLEIPEVTADLMALYADATLPPALQTALTQALQNRTSGLDYMQQALQMKYDYLEQTKSPPMGIIAPSLARFNDAASLDGLMAHLFDHETPATDMTPIAAAILETGNETIVPSLRDFAILYHADTSFLGHEDALATICRAILAFGGTDGSTLVASLRDDPQTLPGLRKQLLVILDPDAEAKAAAKKAEEEQAAALAKQAELEKKKAEAFANRPDYLAPGHIRVMMGKASVLLRPCIKDALSRRMSLTQVRMNFAIDGTTGAASDLKVIPADIPGLEQCLSQAMTKITFPPFKNPRQSASHTIHITGVKRAESTEE